MKSAFNRSILALAAILVVAGVSQASAQQKPLKKYESGTKDFWTNPPPDWFLGDETEAQKGQAPPSGPPTGASDAELAAMMKKIKLPEGFSIEVYASNVLEARQMAWGDKGTLFVGSFSLGNVYAIKDNGGKREVKTVLKGLTMPTGLAFLDGSLYVVAINKLIKYENAEANLDNLGAGKVVYDDMPSYVAHGWKYIAVDKDGWFYLPFGPPFNIGIPPTSVSQVRRVDPKTGNAEIWALGVRNSVGGDVDPRSGRYWFTENARDWISDDMPSDKLNMISKIGEHFGYPYCHQGDLPDPKFAMGHKCDEFTPPVVKLGAHVAPLGMKFYTGDQFPPEYKNNILIAEHGSWNRAKYQGARIKRVIVDADGKNAKSEIFASGWLEGDTTISAGRTTSSSPRTVRSWWPTTGPARSIASATRSRTATIRGCGYPGTGGRSPCCLGCGAEEFTCEMHWSGSCWRRQSPAVRRPAPPISRPARRRPSCASAATARAAFRRWRTFPRSRPSPICSFSGSSCSFAPAPARTSRCSRSSSSSTMRTSATSAPITPRCRRRRRPSPTTIRTFQRRARRRRSAGAALMSHGYLRRHQGGRPHRRPARGISREGAGGLQIGRAGRRRDGGDGGCRLSPQRGRDRGALALSRASLMPRTVLFPHGEERGARLEP
jgi:glucose/arabinose dehydrogenase